MARIRSIKPDFWTDEGLGECSPTARLLFIGTWTVADDFGNLQRSAKQLKAQILPYDSIDCEPLLQELITVGCLQEYEVDGKKYLHIKGFEKHQKIEKRSSPRHPLPDSSPTPPRLPGKNELGREGIKEGKGVEGIKEGKGEDTPPPPKKSRKERLTSLPDNFDISQRVRDWATEKGYDRLEEHLESFKRKCRGKGYTYVEWDDAFMEAIREDWAKLRKNGTGTSKEAVGGSKFTGLDRKNYREGADGF